MMGLNKSGRGRRQRSGIPNVFAVKFRPNSAHATNRFNHFHTLVLPFPALTGILSVFSSIILIF